MQKSALLRLSLLLACCAFLPGCIERIDTAGQPVKPVEQPVVGTHISAPGR